MAVVIDGTTGISTPAETVLGNLSYTGTLTGNGGIVNLGSGQLYKDASGNVGIGTSSPASKLEVSGSGTLELARFATTTDNTPSIGIYSNGAIRAKLRASSAETALLSQGATPLLLGTNDTERARIDSSGNLLVGTTSPAPGYGNTNTGVQISGSGSTFSRAANDYVMVVNQNTADGASYYQMVFRVANVAKGSIISTSTATAYNTSSDYRLKEAIEPMTGALAKVAALKPVTYKWKVDGSDGQGFIAHELAEVVAGCVTGEKDAVDAEGNPQYQGIDTSFLVATLAAAIQEQQAMLAAQAISINALNERLTALEGTAA